MKTITLSSKYQVVIPSAARLKLGITSGDSLVVSRVTATEIVLKKSPTYADLVGIGGKRVAGKKDAVKRIRELRSDWE